MGAALGGFSFATFPKIEEGSHVCMKAAAWSLFKVRVAPEAEVTDAPKITSEPPIEVPFSAARRAFGGTTRSNAKGTTSAKSAADPRRAHRRPVIARERSSTWCAVVLAWADL